MFRQSVEALISLALAVILFRAFVAEGYMISTGSMAPCLLGYHRQVVCPTCTFPFSRGTQKYDVSSIFAGVRAPSNELDLGGEGILPATVCPNCGLSAIDVRLVPRNEGDQLLVHKHLYQLRAPRRWEVVVFRHPEDPDQAYVKRVVGLPGETIELRDGDVYADGQVQRKPISVQQGMRTIVYDHDHEPSDPHWRPRWRMSGDSRWQRSGAGFQHLPAVDEKLDWLTYHHWIRQGGQHKTSVPLAQWPSGVGSPSSLDPRLEYVEDRGTLAYMGVLTPKSAERLRQASDDPRWLAAVGDLEAAPHESPIVDTYGYNHPESSDAPTPVHDLMVEMVIAHAHGGGQFHIRSTDGWHRFEAVFDFATGEVRLHVDDDPHPIRSARMAAGLASEGASVTFSSFDRQVLLAVNGQLLLEPLLYSAEAAPRKLTSRPVQIGAAHLDLEVSHLRIYRDVYYTPKQEAGRTTPSPLGPGEFFVLGDNSPVSVDSRRWETPAIPRELLVGKPLFVHLPSRQARIEFAGEVRHIRIPNFSRVRYIH